VKDGVPTIKGVNVTLSSTTYLDMQVTPLRGSVGRLVRVKDLETSSNVLLTNPTIGATQSAMQRDTPTPTPFTYSIDIILPIFHSVLVDCKPVFQHAICLRLHDS
jgi:hypothetical protein